MTHCDRPQTQEQREEFNRNSHQLESIIRPLPDPQYTIDVDFSYIEATLQGYARDWGLNLAPDFQRGHVWTQQQQSAFIEGVLRGTVGDSQRIIQFNAPHWDQDDHGGDLPNEIQIIDGLQRLTSVRMFLDGKVKAFGLTADAFANSRFSPFRSRYRLRFSVHAFCWRSDLLQYYLDINAGGTPHSLAEILRVTALLEQCNEPGLERNQAHHPRPSA